jgi:Acetyltransferase (GNAT) domain
VRWRGGAVHIVTEVTLQPPVEIRCAITRDDLEEVYRFRYCIYVEEMQRRQQYANRDLRRIEDPLDRTAINLAAWKDGQVIGVIRNNAAADGSVGIYEDFYDMKCVGTDHPARTSITTRLMIGAEHRKSSLAIRLAMASYDIGLSRRIRWNFIDCNDHLVGFFASLGWREYTAVGEHPEYGPVHRMRLDLEDIEHLERVQSPFAGRYRGYTANDQ